PDSSGTAASSSTRSSTISYGSSSARPAGSGEEARTASVREGAVGGDTAPGIGGGFAPGGKTRETLVCSGGSSTRNERDGPSPSAGDAASAEGPAPSCRAGRRCVTTCLPGVGSSSTAGLRCGGAAAPP